MLLALCSLALAVAAGSVALFNSSRTTTIASHDAVIRPTLDRHITLVTGPVLPNVRVGSPAVLGLRIDLGKTEAATTDELFQRYAVLAAEPDGQIAKLQTLVRDMIVESAVRGAAVGLLPVVIWVMLGPERRRDLIRGLVRGHGRPLIATALMALVVVGIWQPWRPDDATLDADRRWVPLDQFLPEVPIPADLDEVQVRADVVAVQSQRLIESAIETYQKSRDFYDQAAEDAAALELHQPGERERVAVLVTDRHDNIGMDRVARAVGDAAGATIVFDGGDDTSTGKPWEAFSLDSLTNAFDGYHRWAITGNHDEGPFVGDYLKKLGWHRLDGRVVSGPDEITLLGTDDPRSSGLGTWRDETGLSFSEVATNLADAACDSDDRVNTVLVHDANLGREVLARGCADLVVGGHTHVQVGPTEVLGPDGQVGYSWTNGTTGGAAYAIAVGSKPKRDATLSLITYASDGTPSGIQWVRLRTDGVFVVGEWEALAPTGGSQQ